MKVLAATGLALLALMSVGCGGESAPDEATSHSTSSAPGGEFGSYPADTSLEEREVVGAYVEALDERDGGAFCRVVASWISGRFDIAGTDPDASLQRPMRCPQLVPGLEDFPWENQERDFRGATVAEFGDLDRRDEELVGVPVTITLRLEEYGRGEYEEPLEDVVWLTKEAGAWRVAKLSTVAAWASLVATERGDDLTTPPDVGAERRQYAAEVAKALALRSGRESSYRAVGTSTTCSGATTYPDGASDVVDYRHPAPSTPTPQLPAADIRALELNASAGEICAVFVMSGDIQPSSTFKFALESPDFDWYRAGFSQGFEVELRADGRARVTSGLDRERRHQTVPAEVGQEGNRLLLVVDRASFSAGEPYPGSRVASQPLRQFRFLASVTVVQSEERHLHDDLGPGPPEGIVRFTYP